MTTDMPSGLDVETDKLNFALARAEDRCRDGRWG
jgi:hypothetical protein